MDRLRLCLLSLLVVMMLPWGAHVRAAQIAPPPDVPAFSALTPARAAPLAHRCRTATLPGSVCSMEFLSDEDEGLMPPLLDDSVPAQDGRLTARPWQDPVPLPPPRLD